MSNTMSNTVFTFNFTTHMAARQLQRIARGYLTRTKYAAAGNNASRARPTTPVGGALVVSLDKASCAEAAANANAAVLLQKIARGYLARKHPHEWQLHLQPVLPLDPQTAHALRHDSFHDEKSYRAWADANGLPHDINPAFAAVKHVTRGGRVAQDGFPCTNAAATLSKTAESDPSALATGTMGEPLTAEKVMRLREHFKKTHQVETFDMTTPEGTPAVVVVVRNLFDNKCFEEITSIHPDFVDNQRRAYGKVGPKNARWNANLGKAPVRSGHIANPNPKLRFSAQAPIKEYPRMAASAKMLAEAGRATGIDLDDLKAEINFYFNQPGKNATQRRDANGYIGFHGDAERNGVIGCNLSNGTTRDIVWREYYRNRPTGRQWRVTLQSGDCYIMCSKACGMDWKRSSIHTHRHAAGSAPRVDWMIAQVDKRIKRKAAPAAAAPAARKKPDNWHQMSEFSKKLYAAQHW